MKSDGELQGRALHLDEGLSWERCGPDAGKLYSASLPPSRSSDYLSVDADAVYFHKDRDVGIFTGDVAATKDDRFLTADWAKYSQRSDLLELKGDLFYRDPDLRLAADEGAFYPDDNRGTITNIRGYRLPEAGARGSADRAVMHDKDHSSYEGASYTTCRPGNDDWYLRADSVDLDQAEGVAVARNASVIFKGVPIFYSPYLSYSIDKRRKSGFLTPEITSLSSTGLDITTPYYLNLAPNYDATLYPRYMTDHGVMLGGEFRFLTAATHGQIMGEYIDDEDAPAGIDEERGSFSLRHWANPARGWATRLHADYVSDNQYITDFGSNLGVTSVVHLERTAEAIYYGNNWRFTSRIQNHQTVDPAYGINARPYSRLPQFLINAALPSANGLTYHLHGEYVAFDRDGTVDGQRIDLMPGISYPVLRPWGHFIPKLSARYTAYELENPGAGNPTNPDRTLPVFSLDSGLVFERDSSWFGQSAIQTLEPRLFYLYTPYENQDDQPIFDSAANGMTFNSLFRENRFTGADRQGDANQVTAALTTRVISNDSGTEWLSASLGQVYSFRDRDVQMPGIAPETDRELSIAGEISSQLTPELTATAYLQWDPQTHTAEKGTARMQYKDDERRIFNLAYRYEDNDINAYDQKQVDTSFHLPVGSNWNLVGRWNYSIDDEKTLDRFAGIEYDSCCWAFRFIARNFVNNNETTNAIFLQLELKGLGSVGHRADREIENGVLGYNLGY